MSLAKELKIYAENLTVLIVEDDAILNGELVELFRMFFGVVYNAFDGEEGLAKYREYSPDIILSDITMPHKNGVEMSKDVREIDKTQPIIILSGHRELQYLNQLVDIGITNFVPKPYELQELLYKLVEVCKQIFENKQSKQNQNDELGALFSDEELLEFHSYDELSRPHVRVNVFNDDLDFDLGSTESSVEELKELNDYFGACMEFYVHDLSQEALHDICSILNQLYQNLSKLEACNRICDIIHNMAVFLEELDFDALNENQKAKLKVLTFFYSDLSRFIKTVYVFKESIDLEYLIGSLQKSLEQLKLNISE